MLRPRAANTLGDQRINSFGIGGEVEVRTGLHVQKQVIASPVVHFGLGEATRADVVRIVWPNGMLQSEFDTPADADGRREPAAEGIVPVAVRLGRSRDGASSPTSSGGRRWGCGSTRRTRRTC